MKTSLDGAVVVKFRLPFDGNWTDRRQSGSWCSRAIRRFAMDTNNGMDMDSTRPQYPLQPRRTIPRPDHRAGSPLSASALRTYTGTIALRHSASTMMLVNG